MPADIEDACGEVNAREDTGHTGGDSIADVYCGTADHELRGCNLWKL